MSILTCSISRIIDGTLPFGPLSPSLMSTIVKSSSTLTTWSHQKNTLSSTNSGTMIKTEAFFLSLKNLWIILSWESLPSNKLMQVVAFSMSGSLQLKQLTGKQPSEFSYKSQSC